MEKEVEQQCSNYYKAICYTFFNKIKGIFYWPQGIFEGESTRIGKIIIDEVRAYSYLPSEMVKPGGNRAFSIHIKGHDQMTLTVRSVADLTADISTNRHPHSVKSLLKNALSVKEFCAVAHRDMSYDTTTEAA